MNLVDKINELFDKPKEIDYYAIFSQLNMLLRSGSDMPKATADIADFQDKKVLGTALNNISRSLRAGISTATAFSKEGIFPRIVSPTIEAGEKSGHLSETFFKLSELMWMQHNLYSKVRNALLVPKIAAVLMTIMAIAYIKIAIPEYVTLYKDNDIPLPVVVEVVTNFVNALVDNWYITLLVIFVGYKGFSWFVENRSDIVDAFKLKMPIYRDLHFNFLQHQFASILSIMLSSGLTEQQSLVQVSKVVDNSVMSSAILKVRDDILKGNSISDSLKKNNADHIFDNLLLASINAGEKSSSVSEALDQCAKYYERTINNLVETVSTKLTFIVMIPIGVVIVAMFAFTMIPMFSYITNVTQ